jgi:replication-associated recombination protein RarA
MIPPTKNGLPAMQVVSAMQKAIRRGQEREAMECACELLHTSKGFTTLVANRLEIISHEDIDTAASPHIVPFVATCAEQARRWYDPVKIGKSRMAIGNAIRMMARAPKSREGDHFGLAVGLASEIAVPDLPDHSADMHTAAGRAKGRGLKHFREHGAKLHPQPAKDRYEDEAYAMLARKHGGKKRTDDLFEE